MWWDCFQLLPGSLSKSPPLFQLPPLLFSSSSFSVFFLSCVLGGGFKLSDRGILHSLICTSSAFSYACLLTSLPIIIRNILGDKKNPCLTPEITGASTVFLHAQFDKQKHQRLKIGTGIPNLVMVFHILLLAAIKSFLQIHRNHRN